MIGAIVNMLIGLGFILLGFKIIDQSYIYFSRFSVIADFSGYENLIGIMVVIFGITIFGIGIYGFKKQ